MSHDLALTQWAGALLSQSSTSILVSLPSHQPTSISTIFRGVIHKERPSEGRLIKYVSIVFLICLSNMLPYSFLLWCALGLQQHMSYQMWWVITFLSLIPCPISCWNMGIIVRQHNANTFVLAPIGGMNTCFLVQLSSSSIARCWLNKHHKY